ncbi:hypothetical protein HSBAA_34350 [Vreelandella sulfidaeris]|uniref:ABC-type dipeptide transporter n=1 Tax=Vreelandella sulfidaeris TaxID=115553 RepID=A0A455UCF6_9GAMM|nr:hypothetical protein HSBAA_34350 [Halomonas sulfidaeris]
MPSRLIMWRHVLPNAMVATLTFIPFLFTGAIGTLTALDFLGFGLPPGAPSLGELAAQGKNNLHAPWLGITAFMTLAIMLSLLVFIGEGLRDAFDPATCNSAKQTLPRRPSMPEPLLHIENLNVSFDGTPVVHSLSLTLHAGETLAIVGESGSGKSVSALGMVNLLPSNASIQGERWLGDTNLASLTQAQWNGIRGNRVGFIFQEPMTSLNPLHRVGKQIGEALRLHQGLRGQAARQRSKALLEQVKLPRADELLNAWPHQLSGGQRQR